MTVSQSLCHTIRTRADELVDAVDDQGLVVLARQRALEIPLTTCTCNHMSWSHNVVILLPIHTSNSTF
jgi:hypothetical protein